MLGSLAEIVVQYLELFGCAIRFHQPSPCVSRIFPVFQVPAELSIEFEIIRPSVQRVLDDLSGKFPFFRVCETICKMS